jgi:hypothetical protein
VIRVLWRSGCCQSTSPRSAGTAVGETAVDESSVKVVVVVAILAAVQAARLVPMMEPTQLRDGDDPSGLRCLDGA